MGGIVLGEIRVITNAARTGQHIIAFQVIGKKYIDRARKICSLIEDALKLEGIETQYDDVEPGVFTLENTVSFGSDDAPSAKKMETIAFRVLQEVKKEMDTDASPDRALEEVGHKYNSMGLGGFNYDDSPAASRTAATDQLPAEDEMSPRNALADALVVRLTVVRGPRSGHEAPILKAASDLADAVMALPDADRTEENFLKLAQAHIGAFCQNNGIKIMGGPNKDEDKTPGFIAWQAMETMPVIRDTLAEGAARGVRGR